MRLSFEVNGTVSLTRLPFLDPRTSMRFKGLGSVGGMSSDGKGQTFDERSCFSSFVVARFAACSLGAKEPLLLQSSGEVPVDEKY